MLKLGADAVVADLTLHLMGVQLLTGGLFQLVCLAPDLRLQILCLAPDLLLQIVHGLAGLLVGLLDLAADGFFDFFIFFHFLFLPFFDPSIKGVGLQIELAHGLTRGDLAAAPALGHRVEQRLIDGDGLAALVFAVLFGARDALPAAFVPVRSVQLRQLPAELEEKLALGARGVETLFGAPEIHLPGAELFHCGNKLTGTGGNVGETVDQHTVARRQLLEPGRQLAAVGDVDRGHGSAPFV